MKSYDQKVLSRRRLLKTSAASVAGATGIVGTAIANETRSRDEIEQIIKESYTVQEGSGTEERIEYLVDNGLEANASGGTTTVPAEGVLGTDSVSEGEITPEVDCVDPRQCDGEIDLELAVISDPFTPSEWFAELSIRYYYYLGFDTITGEEYLGPDDPEDGASITWEDSLQPIDADDVDESHSEDDFAIWDNGSLATNEGTGFLVDSYGRCQDDGLTDPSEYKEWSSYIRVGVWLEKDGTDDAEVTAAYEYTWSGGEVSGVSVSYPWGVSVSASSTTESDDLQTDLDGINLREEI